MERGRARRVDDAEAAQVFRRAAELEHPAPAEATRLDERALAEIGALVGLSEDAILRAVREQRLGLLERPPRRWPRLEGSGVAEVADVLAGGSQTVERALAAALSDAGLEVTARWGDRSRWEARPDHRRRVKGAWAARTALAAVTRVDVRLRSADGLTRVRLEGRVGAPRWVAAVTAWVAVLFFSPLVVAGLASVAEDGVAAIGYTAALFAAPMVVVVRLARSSLRRARRHTREALGSALARARDRLPRRS